MSAAELDALTIAMDPVGQVWIALALFTIMFGVALGLKISDFSFLRKAPKLFFGGVAAQIILLPLTTLALIAVLSPPPSVALGMIVVAACPGGNTSNMLTFLGRGDVAYSVSLTAASSVLAAILTPAAILFWSSLYPPTADLLTTIEIDRVAFVGQTTALLALPLSLGMATAAFFPAFAERARKSVALTGAAALGGVIIYGTWSVAPALAGALTFILPIAVLHNALAFTTGALAATALKAPGPVRRALVFEVGIQNSGLAIVILISQLAGLGGAAAMAAVWGIWHLIGGGIIVAIFRRLDKKGAPPNWAAQESLGGVEP